MSQDTVAIVAVVTSVVGCLANVAMAIGTVVLVYFALKGLDQWRENIRGQAKFELARSILLASVKFQDGFHFTRTAGTYSGEYQGRPKPENERQDYGGFYDERFARFNRFQALSGTVIELSTAKIEAEVLLDKDVCEAIGKIENIYSELRKAMNAYFNEQLYQLQEREDGIFQKRMYLEPIIYGMQDDKMNKRADEAVLALKEALKAYLNVMPIGKTKVPEHAKEHKLNEAQN